MGQRAGGGGGSRADSDWVGGMMMAAPPDDADRTGHVCAPHHPPQQKRPWPPTKSSAWRPGHGREHAATQPPPTMQGRGAASVARLFWTFGAKSNDDDERMTRERPFPKRDPQPPPLGRRFTHLLVRGVGRRDRQSRVITQPKPPSAAFGACGTCGERTQHEDVHRLRRGASRRLDLIAEETEAERPICCCCCCTRG